MIRTKEQILNELQNGEYSQEDLSIEFASIIKNATDDLDLKNKLIDFTNTIADKVKKSPLPKDYLELKNDKTLNQYTVEVAISKYYAIKLLKYYSFLADLLSIFREDSGCMKVCKLAYSAYDIKLGSDILDDYYNAQENLAILYSDKNCTLFDLGNAFTSFTMAKTKYPKETTKDVFL